jgi:hypothetical protein
MLTDIRRVRRTWTLINARLPEFLRVLHLDLGEFKFELLRAVAGAVLGAIGGFLFTVFLSIAILVSAWDTPHRALVAWLICLVWAGIAQGGLLFARRTLRGPQPFGRVSTELLRDVAQVKKYP